MAQRSLFQFGISSVSEQKRSCEIDSERLCSTPTKRSKSDSVSEPGTPKTNEVSDCETPKSIKSKRKFRSEWLDQFEWLDTRDVDGQTLLFCTWCRDARIKNPFATSGSTNLQKSALDRHMNSNPEHQDVLLARQLVKCNKTVKHVIEVQDNNQTTESAQSKEAQLKTAYFVAKNNLPQRIHNELVNLQTENGCPSLQNKATIYTSVGVLDEMVDAINEEILDSVRSDLNYSDFVGVIVDETTDITIHKKLNIYFKCFKTGTSETVVHFVDCVSVPNGKAETLVKEIERACENNGLDLLKVISMASDGASVMTGRKGGVGALMRKKNPRLVQVHCVAHRLALCAGQACRDVQAFSDYHHTVKTIYRYFHNSAVRYNTLREMETVLGDENGDTKHVTLKEPASFRWLSLESAVKAIYQVYPALLMALENEAANGSSEAKGILKSVRSVSFLLKSAFLVDVLFTVNKLCKVFQKEELDIDTVNISVASTKDSIESYKVKNGTSLQSVYDQTENGKFKGVKLTDTQHLRIGFQNSAEAYINTLIDNINCRFEEKSMDKLTVANRVLNPKQLPVSTVAICGYGHDDLETIINWMGPTEGTEGLIDPERMRGDFLQVKMTVKNMRGKSLKYVCQELADNCKDTLPDFCTLAKYMLTAPLTSVACERGFSTQNRLKTKSRNGMTHEKVAKLIRIIEEGPDMSNFPSGKVLRRFEDMRKRKK